MMAPEGMTMNERTESHPVDFAEELSDRAAGGLLLAFLTTVLVVLAVGTTFS
jgi:hypothetical protein